MSRKTNQICFLQLLQIIFNLRLLGGLQMNHQTTLKLKDMIYLAINNHLVKKQSRYIFL